jgi:PAS domain S-box-containing protein
MMPRLDTFPVPDRVSESSLAREQARSFALIAGAFVVLLLISLAATLAAVAIVDSTRAYAVGEGRYAKAQKIAVSELRRFAHTRDDKDYDAFMRAIAVPRGDRAAREALQGDPADLSAARAGFLQGQNHPDDASGLIRLFRAFSWWKPFAAAVADWAAADRLIENLADAGAHIKALSDAGALTDEARITALTAVKDIDDSLTAREDTFSADMGAAARAATNLVVIGMTAAIVVLWAIGMILAARLFRRQLTLDRRLGDSEQRFRGYAEAASDWYWETDAAKRITYVSERFLAITGAPPADIIGRDAVELLTEYSSGDENREAFEALAALQPIRSLTLRYARADGTATHLSLSAKPRVDGAGNFLGYRGVGTDVTAAMEDARALREAKEHAELANRAKSEFLANMSHELRTPLNAIIGFSEIIINEQFGPGERKRYDSYVRDINDAGKHLLSIINDILDLAKIEAGREELNEANVYLDEIIASAQLLFRGRFEAGGLSLAVELPDPPPLLHVDQRKIKQCLANLLSNALKFTPPGGRVWIAARFDAHGDLAITVRDTGIGIAAADIPTVLSPFGQVESSLQRSHNGTGLGLPIVRGLIQLHGGTLSLESRLGSGTSITLTIPASRIVAPPLRAVGAV